MEFFSAERVNSLLDWGTAIEALRAAHKGARPQIADMHMQAASNGLLCRIAWDGAGIGVKAVTIFPENVGRVPELPSIQGVFLLCSAESGQPLAVIDGAAITTWKTAADSALGADLLARRDTRTLLMVGAGAMAAPLIDAHLVVRPGIERILLWNRTASRAAALRDRLAGCGRRLELVDDLQAAMAQADIVSSATMAHRPLIRGAWLRPGTHLDLVGAYKADMREADDEALLRSRVFVDSKKTVLEDIGELLIPLQQGTIGPDAVLGDLFDLVGSGNARLTDTEITLFKNGGGAHLDLMIAQAIHRAGGATA